MKKGKITYKDFAVITALWLPHLIDSWLASWVDLTIKIVYAPDDVNFGYLRANKISLFACKCLLCLGLAIFVDLHGYLKYSVYFMSLGLFATTPIFALAMFITKEPILAYIVPWIASSLFITMPIKFCLIFNQRINSPYHQTRIIVAAFEFFKSVGTFIFIKLAQRQEERNPMSLIGIWLFVQSLFVFLLTITDMARKSATRESRRSNNMKSVVAGIRKDTVVQIGDSKAAAHRKRIVKRQFWVFVILLFPIICVTMIGVTLPKVANGVGQHVLSSGPPYAVYEVLINLVLIPAFAMGFSFLKEGYGTTADYVLVLFGHAFNTAVVSMLFLVLFEPVLNANYYQLPPSKGSNFTTIEVEQGYVPDAEKAVFNVMGNHPFYMKLPDEKPLGTSNNGYSVEAWPARRRHFNIRAWIDDHVLQCDFDIKPKTRYLFQALSDGKRILKLFRVYGAETIEAVPGPVLLIMNSVVGETTNGSEVHRDSKENWIEIIITETKEVNSYVLPPSDQILRIVTKPGNQTIGFRSTPLNRCVRTSICNERLLFSFSSYTEYLVIISPATQKFDINDVKISVTVRFTPSHVEITEKTVLKVKAIFALRGFTSAASTVGYLHFFWIESPLRLRTTLFAGFIVVNEIAAFATDQLISKIDESVTIMMLVTCVAGLVIQFSFGLYYDCKLKKALSSPYVDIPPKKKNPSSKKIPAQ